MKVTKVGENKRKLIAVKDDWCLYFRSFDSFNTVHFIDLNNGVASCSPFITLESMVKGDVICFYEGDIMEIKL